MMPSSRVEGKRKATSLPSISNSSHSSSSSESKVLDSSYDPEEEEAHPADHLVIHSPKRRKKGTVLDTPQRRIEKDDPRRQPAAEVAKLVAKVAPHGYLCSHSYTEGSVGSVQKMHALQRASSYQRSDIMGCLERLLKIAQGALNLDTRFNQEFVAASLHWCHDNGGHAVIPLLIVLEQFLDLLEDNSDRDPADRERWDQEIKMPETGWGNLLLPINMNTRETLFRKVPRQDPVTKEWHETAEFSAHQHPYHTYGIIYSHIHPYFRIIDAYFKIKDIENREYWSMEQKMCVQKIRAIMVLLTEPQPPPPDADRQIDEDNLTPIAKRTRGGLRKNEEQANAPANEQAGARARRSTQSKATRPKKRQRKA